ncbi:MAG: hypothetical protein J6O49_14380, partial [Bacteroidaceae bacterium]|nr:hypothetical protein [Bacteroidaceae bacterium]
IVKTLVGFAYISGETKTLTVFDVDGAGADVEQKINELRTEINNKLGTSFISSANTVEANLTALSGTSSASSADTSVWGAKIYASSYTESIIDGLEGSVTAADGSYVKSVTQVDGKISGTTAALPTVGAISGEGQAITAVSQSNGTIAASAGDIAASHVTVVDSGGKFTATTVEAVLAEIDAAYKAADTAIIGGASASADTLGEIEGIINQMKTDEKTYTIAEITSGLASNVRKAYKLVDEDGTQSGATIEIYKDSSLQSVELVNEDPTQEPAKQGQFLKFTYVTDSETTDIVYLDVSTFLVEAEFKDGLQVNNGEVSIKLDTNGDDTGTGKFLTVSSSGLKLDGVTDAISAATEAAVNALDSTVTGSTSGSHITISIEELDGKLVQSGLTIQENDIASASVLTAEIEHRKAVDGVQGDAYTANTSMNYISGATSLKDADEKLDGALKSLNDDVIKGVKVNGSGLTETNNEVNIQISSAAATGTDASPIVVDTDANGAVTLTINYIDAGIYDAE